MHRRNPRFLEQRIGRREPMSCFLVFSESSGGSLFAHWSEETVDGALATFAAGKPVPKFK